MFIVLKTINQKVNKMDRIKFNIWVFFARIKLKRKIKGLKQEMSETMLKGLQYA